MLTADRLLGLVVLVKAVDLVDRGHDRLAGPLWLLVLVVWVAGGLALVSGRVPSRHAWGMVLVGGLALAYDSPLEPRREHLVFVLGAALAAVVAVDERERLLLWRVWLTVLYGISVLAKLNESYLSGNVLAEAVFVAPTWSHSPFPFPSPPLLVAASAAIVLVEATLAITPWVGRLRVPGVVLAGVLHSSILVLVTSAPLIGLRLTVFGASAVVLNAACAGLLSEPEHVRR